MSEPKTHTITIEGMKVRTKTARRYIAIITRTAPWTDPADGRDYKPFIEVVKRTDNYGTAMKELRYRGLGIISRVFDTATGQVIA